MRLNVKYVNQNWHRWFAWHPVQIDHQYVWLEYVYRKGVKAYYGYKYEYRLGLGG